jgi:anthranilate phosphoribosyltransferase
VHAMAVSGDGNLDELATTGASIVHELRDGEVRRYEVTPDSVGLARATPEQLAGGDASANVAKAKQVLSGEPGPVRDIVVLNAAAGLVVAGVADDLGAGVVAAQSSIDTGAAAAALDRLLTVARSVG